MKAPNRDWIVSHRHYHTFQSLIFDPSPASYTCEMALIAKKAASLSFVIPLRLGGRRRQKEVGQNELKRFTAIWAADKMAWQWKTYREADSCPEGTHINAAIRRKRVWLCFYASHATTDTVTPWQITRAEQEWQYELKVMCHLFKEAYQEIETPIIFLVYPSCAQA